MGFAYIFKSSGFGIERLGLLALRAPRLTVALLILITLVLGAGVGKVGFSADIRDVFRGDTAIFATFERMTRIFPGSELDLQLIIEDDGTDAAGLFTPERLEALRDLQLDMNFIKGVKGVVSIFSLRRKPDEKGHLSPLFPADLGEIGDMTALRDRVTSHPLVQGKLLSANGRMTLYIISLDPARLNGPERKDLFAEIETFVRDTIDGTGLNYTLAGKPALYSQVIDELVRDQFLFKLLGMSLAVLISWIFFRNFRYVLLASLPPFLASIWLYGLMGWAGFSVNALTNVVPTLVMVIAFTNSVHMLFALRRYLALGMEVVPAMRNALLEVGPATVLATLTTAIALLSLVLAGQQYIVNFGLLAAAGAMFSLLVVLLAAPAVAAGLIVDPEPPHPRNNLVRQTIGKICVRAAYLVHRAPKVIFAAGAMVAILALVLHSFNKPYFLSKEYLPDGNPTVKAIEKVDDNLSGASSLYIYLQWPKTQDMRGERTLALIRDAHRVMAETSIIRAVWSLETVLDWLGQGNKAQQQRLFDHMQKNDSPTGSRIISFPHHAALITGFLKAPEASRFLPVITDLEQRLQPLHSAYPEAEIAVTGLSAISAVSTHRMIGLLNRSLGLAMLFNIFLIGFCFRSWRFSLYAVLPNVLPIAIAGGALYLFGQGLQFTSIVAFTIAFGIAVDNTIHFLHRFRLERENGLSVDDAITSVLATVGPVLVLTTVILAAGIGVTMLSHLPMVQIYGRLTVLILSVAVLGAMLVLPSILKTVIRETSK